MYKRSLQISDDSDQSFFLFGPRGTGKTTWLKKHFKNAVYLDLLDSKLHRTLLANPEKLSHHIPPHFKDWIILDEVQKIPQLLDEVHRLIEDSHYKFILTGSSARSLRKKGINLLAGRAVTHHMFPLIYDEVTSDFVLERSLKFGQLPTVYQVDHPVQYLESYVQTYLKEEVQHEGLTRNIGNFSRFMEIASFSQAQILTVSDIAREVEVERKTVENYFAILDDLLLAHTVPVFNKRAKRKLVKHKKFYYFDVGIYRVLRPRGPLDRSEEIDGAALETLIFQHLRAINEYHDLGYKIYYWRSITGLEVDFILYGPRGIIAIEVKRKSSIFKKALNGLAAFQKDYPETTSYLFCTTKQKEYHGNVTVLPIENALKNLRKILENKE